MRAAVWADRVRETYLRLQSSFAARGPRGELRLGKPVPPGASSTPNAANEDCHGVAKPSRASHSKSRPGRPGRYQQAGLSWTNHSSTSTCCQAWRSQSDITSALLRTCRPDCSDTMRGMSPTRASSDPGGSKPPWLSDPRPRPSPSSDTSRRTQAGPSPQSTSEARISPRRGTRLGPKTVRIGRFGSRTLGLAGLLRSGPVAIYRSGIR